MFLTMIRTTIHTATLALLFATLSTLPQAKAYLDLHAHLDLKPGVGPLLRGNFDSPPLAESWNSRLSTKASSESLLALKGPRIIVMSIYSHPVLSHLRTSQDLSGAEAQYVTIMNFIEQHPDRFALARNALQAKALFEQNKIVIILSIEGAAGNIDTPEGFQRWIVDRGVAIVTPFHLTEDHLGGTALMGHWKGLFNSPLEFLKSLWLSKGACLKQFCKSPVGIKAPGRELIQKLIEHQVWIDLAHANELETKEILNQTPKLPLLVTHTQVRDIYPIERALGDLEMNYLSQHDGIIGLIPTDDMIETNGNSLDEFRSVVKTLSETVGEEKITLGTDINAPLTGLPPSQHEHSAVRLKNGFYRYEQLPELETWVQPSVNWKQKTKDHFLALWQRIRPT